MNVTAERSSINPGIVVVDSDDEAGEALVKERCPETPMMQVTGSGGSTLYCPNDEAAVRLRTS